MSDQPTTPKPSRTPWIIAGVLGCLVICLLVALVGGGLFFITSRSVTVMPTSVPVVVQPTVPPVPTKPIVVVSSAASSSAPASSAASSSLPSSSASSASSSSAVAPTAPLPTIPLPTIPLPTQAPAATKPPAGPTGKVVFSKSEGDAPENQSIWIMNADGSSAKKILDRSSHPAVSSDGTRIVYYHWTDGLFIANLDGTNAKKLVGDTFTGGNYGSPAWSHDGRFIAFSAQPGGSGNIVIDRVSPDPANINRVNITVGEGPAWSPDDTQIVFHTCRGSACGIFKSSSAPGSAAMPVVEDDGGLAVWSPSGNRILYQKEVDGQKQLFVINADGSGKKQLTSGATLHVDGNWSADGNFIFYRSPQGGSWGIWVMGADGSNPRQLIANVAPVNWPYERLAVSK